MVSFFTGLGPRFFYRGRDLRDDRVAISRLDEIGESNEGYLVKSYRD